MASGDSRLIQIVDAALTDAARKSGAWLLCRPGCSQCCLGDFPITQLDAERLRLGLSDLEQREPSRAAEVKRRVREAAGKTAEQAEDAPCPVLDPSTGTCDLYSARPMTCRTFGPPVRCEAGDLGICELCFDGATQAEIEACAVEFDPEGLERDLLDELEARTGRTGETSVTAALLFEN
ncbi:MAG: YkgJ family cysteine cluster protein [Bryobacteraceae bacterium]